MDNTEVVEKKSNVFDDVKDVVVKHPFISAIVGVKAFEYFTNKNKSENNNTNFPLIALGVFGIVAYMYKNC